MNKAAIKCSTVGVGAPGASKIKQELGDLGKFANRILVWMQKGNKEIRQTGMK
jgi:hypothetical protein